MRNLIKHLHILHFTNDGFFASLILLLPFISESIKLDLNQVGIIAGIMRGLPVFLLFPIAYLSTKYSNFKIILAGLLFFSLASLGFSLSASFLMLMLFAVVAGIGFSPYHPLSYSIISRLFPKGKKGKAMGNLSAAGETGKLGMTFLITTLVAYIGWRTSSFVLGIVGILVFVFLAVTFQKKSSHAAEQTEREVTKVANNGYRRLLREPNFLLASLSSAIDYFAGGSLFIFLPFLLLDKGLDPKFLGLLTGALFLGNILGKTLLGRATDKLGYSKVIIVSEIFMSILLFSLIKLNSFPVIAILLVILGVFTKGTGPVLMALISDSVDHLKNYEKAFSLSETVDNIAGTLAPLIFGLIGGLMGIKAVFVVMAILTLLVLLPVTIYKFRDKD